MTDGIWLGGAVRGGAARGRLIEQLIERLLAGLPGWFLPRALALGLGVRE